MSDKTTADPRWERGIVWLGNLLAILLVLSLCNIFVSSTKRFSIYSPIGEVEEASYTYTSAQNYLRYGFPNSALLQDFSSSSSPADHPYVYDHMPPGPDILTAILMWIYGPHYGLIRLTFAAIFIIGLLFYVQFADLVLRGANLSGGVFAILLIGPWALFSNFDHQNSSPFPLLAFGALLALDSHYRSSRRSFLILAMVLTLIASVYLQYVLMAAVVWCWIWLYVTKLVRMERKHLLLFLAVVSAGVAIHLLQNLVYLGPSLFIRELTMTLGNRTLGVPSQAEIESFYATHGIVFHGAHALDLHVWLNQLSRQVTFDAMTFVLALIGASLLWALLKTCRIDPKVQALVVARGEAATMASYFGRLCVWIAGTVLLPAMMFPAFNQEVALNGDRSNLYFIGIGVVAALGYGLKVSDTSGLLRSWWRLFMIPGTSGARRIALPILLLVPALAVLFQLLSMTTPDFAGAQKFLLMRGVINIITPVALLYIAINMMRGRDESDLAGERGPHDVAGPSPGRSLRFILETAAGKFVTWSSAIFLVVVCWLALGIPQLTQRTVFLLAIGVLALGAFPAITSALGRVGEAAALNMSACVALPANALASILVLLAVRKVPYAIESLRLRVLIALLIMSNLVALVLFSIRSVRALRTSKRQLLPTIRAALKHTADALKGPSLGQQHPLFSATPWILAARTGLAAVVVSTAIGLARGSQIELESLQSVARTFTIAQLGDLSRFSGNWFMTNINTPTVGFFVNEAGYGVCDDNSVSASGTIDTSHCQIAFIRQRNPDDDHRPGYFFFFTLPQLFPGFANCLPSGTLSEGSRGGATCLDRQHERLISHFPRVFSNAVFEAFDLKHPLSTPSS